ncbi:MAG: hypothetical protein C0469_17240 [Cyanobacteria bacterium DS2.3.42]|nr:hypothetical protein [Cyanobacteria bacterium DS2.3.42]
MTVLYDEHCLVKDVFMPFLKEHWDNIDRPEPTSDYRDGRLTRDELMLSHEEATREGRVLDAFILNELIVRYEPICRSHNDGYWSGDEMVLGISEEDVSVYEQMVSADYRKRTGIPTPKSWL